MKKILFTLLISFLVLISFVGINAETSSVTADISLDEEIQASDLDVGDPKLLPGHPFYFFKNWVRNIRSVLTFDPIKKAVLEVGFASEKLIELKKMTKLNMEKDRLEKAIDDYQEKVQKTEELTVKITEKANENEKVKDFSEQITHQYILHQKILEKLEDQVPTEVYAKIEIARNEHLDKFEKTLSHLENTIDIPDRLIVALNNIDGSDFKEVKDVEILDQLKERLPEQLTEKMEEKIEGKIENLREKLEEFSPEKQEDFQEYIENTNGDEEIHLSIIDNIRGKVLSDDLEKIIDVTREKSLQKIIEVKGINLDLSNLQTDLIDNEDLLEKVKTLILEKDIDKNTMPGVFRLIEDAEISLDKAKEHLEGENYSEAFGEIKSSLSLSKNTENLIKRIAGFNVSAVSIDDGTTITCNDSINSPVCGVNGKTYRNICEAQRENIRIAYRGECREQERECAMINEQVNRNPLLGPTDQKCCEGLKEFRTSKNYSICKKSDSEFECVTDEDCPLSSCAGKESKCVDNKCLIPLCANEISCIQVITPAKSPDGICKEFPTPCDVPAGWIRVNACESQAIQLKDSDRQEQIETKVQLREEAIKAQEAESGAINN